MPIGLFSTKYLHSSAGGVVTPKLSTHASALAGQLYNEPWKMETCSSRYMAGSFQKFLCEESAEIEILYTGNHSVICTVEMSKYSLIKEPGSVVSAFREYTKLLVIYILHRRDNNINERVVHGIVALPARHSCILGGLKLRFVEERRRYCRHGIYYFLSLMLRGM
jgi:hypothetical protein